MKHELGNPWRSNRARFDHLTQVNHGFNLQLFALQMYSTVVRNDRRRGRAIECFVDDRCRIFYAPRSKMEKISMKTPSAETLRPSYKKLMDAHARSLAAGEGLGASVDDTRKRESNKSDNELLQQKGSSAWRLHDAGKGTVIMQKFCRSSAAIRINSSEIP